MRKYAYDLHIHSCLSPCGDSVMTPANIVNMAHLKGLDIIAITDHNSTRNVGAAIKAAAGLPLTVIPGIEVTTAEEIHVVCLFPDLDSASTAGKELEKHLPQIPNDSKFFGKQQVLDEKETVLETYPYLLLNAIDISIDALSEIIESYGGICYPAHIDRTTNSIISVLGQIPETFGFSAVEVFNPNRFFENKENECLCENQLIITSSDAHRLGEISDPVNFLWLEEATFAALKKAFSAAGDSFAYKKSAAINF